MQMSKMNKKQQKIHFFSFQCFNVINSRLYDAFIVLNY